MNILKEKFQHIPPPSIDFLKAWPLYIYMELKHKDIETLACMIAEHVVDLIVNEKWLKIEKACRYAKMSKNTIMECILNGDIRAKKREKGGWIVDRQSIDEYNGSSSDDALYQEVAKRAGIC